MTFRLFSGQFYRCQEIFVKVNKRTSTYLADVEYLFQLCIEKNPVTSFWERNGHTVSLNIQKVRVHKMPVIIDHRESET
jgi:hypothetical protein